jgi:hypothetical protein
MYLIIQYTIEKMWHTLLGSGYCPCDKVWQGGGGWGLKSPKIVWYTLWTAPKFVVKFNSIFVKDDKTNPEKM